MIAPTSPLDRLARPIRNLRISVTDRCNMRCRYCMPEDEYVWLPRQSILTFEEIDRVAGVFAHLGVGKIRLTGGEPLLRHDLPTLVALLARHPELSDLALTTNGILLERQAAALAEAGLRRATVSLDTLRPERMIRFARSARHGEVQAVDPVGVAEERSHRDRHGEPDRRDAEDVGDDPERSPQARTSIRPLTLVPAPGSERTVRSPWSAPSRSAIPCSPVPFALDAGSNPRPSSTTSNVRCPFDCARITVAELASAYLATFWRASRHEK